ncbi:acyl-CoA dehydrogenase N-terminal domain-containing protein [Cupriavidus sp. YR651]|uniref:acyl-CoA dehydrogenase N-terminal domain-containing protein n=1 Tax=Cupriavidus sp. YR651 TaxID=1855315 RepID=UPI000B861C96
MPPPLMPLKPAARLGRWRNWVGISRCAIKLGGDSFNSWYRRPNRNTARHRLRSGLGESEIFSSTDAIRSYRGYFPMTYHAPLKDMRFILDAIASFDAVHGLPGFEEASWDVACAVLEEAADRSTVRRARR